MQTRWIALVLKHVVVGTLAGAVAMTAACGGGDGSTGGGGAAATGGGSAKRGPAVLGETLTTRVIQDQQQGLAVGVVAVPASWKYESKVAWNYAWISNPVVLSANAENPANEEAVYVFPWAQFFDLKPGRGFYPIGQNMGGLIYAPPTPPIETLGRYISQLRGREQDLTFVGSKDLPELPAALKMPPSENQRGIGIKVTYTMNGKPVEEEFYAVAYQVVIPFDGPQGRTFQINWGLMAPHSFRAAAGTLDKRRPVFAAIAKSFRPNPAWQQRVAAINAYLAEQFNQQTKAGYDQIAAAGRISQAISANNDAMIAAIDQKLAASRTTSGGGASAGSSTTDKFDDYIRGVTTLEDPYYGTSQQTNTKDFHWTDGYGNYKSSNDVSYDPNRTEVGNWQAMRPVR